MRRILVVDDDPHIGLAIWAWHNALSETREKMKSWTESGPDQRVAV